MTAWPRPGRPTSRIAAIVALLALSGCGEADPDPAGTSNTARCAPPSGERLPQGLLDVVDLGDLVVASEVVVEAQSINATGLADRPVAEVIEVVREAITDGGWELLSFDNEGFEAEILGTNAAGDLLGAELSIASCEEQTRVALSLVLS